MKTSKPFSTISYCTEHFITDTLNRLVVKGYLYFWCGIEHQPEEDEKKSHKHLFLVPNGQVDTDRILDELKELDLENPTSPPLGCLMPRKSNFDDWYLYSKHDVDYLALKRQARVYHYTDENFFYSSKEEFDEFLRNVDYNRLFKHVEFFKGVEDGLTLTSMVKAGIVPAGQFNQYSNLYFAVLGELDRNGGTTHTPKHGGTGCNPVISPNSPNNEREKND